MNTTTVTSATDVYTGHDAHEIQLVRDWCKQAIEVLRDAWQDLTDQDDFTAWAVGEIRADRLNDNGTWVPGLSLRDCKKFWLARNLPDLPEFPITRPWATNVKYYFHDLDEMQIHLNSDVATVEGHEIAQLEESISVDPARGYIESWDGVRVEVLVNLDDISEVPATTIAEVGRAITTVAEQLEVTQ